MAWSLVDVGRSLGTCPWGTLARSTLPVARPRPVPDVAALTAPFAADALDALADLRRPGASSSERATWLPLHGAVAWSLPAATSADALTEWMRWRLTDAFHAARVARESRDRAAGEHAVALVAALRERHPLGSAPLWSTAMEAALRAVRLLHVAELLAGSGVDLAPVRLALAEHEAFLRSRTDWRLVFTGNHHLVALAGRFMLAACLPASPARRADARRAWRLFWRELRREIHSDGLHFESSTGYHLLAVEAAAHLALVGQRLGHVVPRAARARLAAAASATALLARPDGTLAAIGDADDGAFLDLSPAASSPRPLDATAACALLALATGDRDCAARAAGSLRAQEAAAWLLGREGLGRLESLSGRVPLLAGCMPEGGLTVLATDGMPAAHVTVSSTWRGRAGTGGHGHDDATAYELWLGAPLVVDRGTGAYARDRALRQRLRSVRAHAAVQVDRREQNDASTRDFGRPDRSRPVILQFSPSAGGSVSIGHHGYCSPPRAVGVVRRLELATDGELEVIDELTGAGEHDVVLRLPWAPGVAAVDGRGDATGFDVLRDGARVATLDVSAVLADGSGPRGSARHVESEHAPRQLEVERAWTTEVSWRCRLPLTVRHRIRPAGPRPPRVT